MSCISVEQTALLCYEKNMEYLEKNHPEVYKKLYILEEAISCGQYQEQYELRYQDQGYFDIKECATDKYLYNDDSKKIGQQLARLITFSKKTNVIETFYHTNLKVTFNANSLDSPLFAMLNILLYLENHIPSPGEFRNIEKIIFFGSGLGTHFEPSLKRTNSSTCLLVEDNIELFRLSLFVIDFNKIFKKRNLFISVMPNDNEVCETIIDFLDKGYNENHRLKYISLGDNYVPKIKQFQDCVITQNQLSYPYNSFLKRYLKSPEYLFEGQKFINISQQYADTSFSSKPILLLGAGPSLQKNIKWIEQHQNNFIIVSVMAAVKTLQKNNITPDVVTHIDPGRNNSLSLIDGVDFTKFEKSVCIFSANVHTDVVKAVSPLPIYFFEQATRYKKGFGDLSAPSIGEATYALSLILGAKKIYLLGLDLSLDPETGKTHTEEHPSSAKGFGEIKIETVTDIRKTKMQVKGNFLDTVETLPLFKTSIRQFNNFTKTYKNESITIYNLSNGAYLPSAIPMKIEEMQMGDFDKIDKNNYYHKIHDFLDSISSDEMTAEDLDIFNLKIEAAKNIVQEIDNYKKQQVPKNMQLFKESFGKLINTILGVYGEKQKQDDIHYVYYMYFKIMTGFVFDLFNTKDLKLNKKELRHFNNLLLVEIEKIVQVYLSEMEKYILEIKKD